MKLIKIRVNNCRGKLNLKNLKNGEKAKDKRRSSFYYLC